jgi:hypothetical protein
MEGRKMTSRITRKVLGLSVALVALAPLAARALPDAPTLLADVGYTPDQIAKIQAGELVRGEIAPSSPRELVAASAFLVDVPPAKLIEDLRAGLGVKVDENVTAWGDIGSGGAADFAKSKIAATPEDKAMLAGRVAAYRAKGLAGIEPVARGKEQRSIADELRNAISASKPLAKYEPAAYQLLLDYPAKKPPGFGETFRWTEFDAHGTPTLALTHGMFVPDGDAFLVVQRQFYVSTGYNCEQAVAAFVPTGSGTLVVYANRTSTDQITGIGGGAKRSLGSKMLASQLEGMFERLRKAAGP